MTVARDACGRASEANWRTAANRAYYGTMLEIRDAFTRWGLSVPPPAVVHTLVLQRLFTSKDGDMKLVGRMLDDLRRLRRLADYETGVVWQFASKAEALGAVRRAEKALALFDAIDADASRRSTILAEIQAVHP